MTIHEKKVVYLISGTCGVGKSSIAKELTQYVKPSALIMGDEVNFMLLPGSELPMEQRFSLTWENMISLTKNFLRNDLNVVIEWIIQNYVNWICEQLSDFDVKIKYVVLRADDEILMERLGIRGDSHLLDRSLFLLDRLDNLPQNKKVFWRPLGSKFQKLLRKSLILSIIL